VNAQQHRSRLQNLREAHQAVQSCARTHSIGACLAGQVVYNLGEYPAPFSIAPRDYDHRLLREFAEHGVGLIQLHEEWNDAQRRLDADKFTSHDPEGLKRFIELVHSYGMKIILYVSTGYFEATDPDFRPEWAGPDHHLVELWYDYAHCSAASPEWRAYLLPRLERIMDEYGVDGLYDDLGCWPQQYERQPPDPTHVSPAPETPEHAAALEDLLGLVMDLVHKRGGVFKIHHGGATAPACKSKVYDYLWVGEAIADLDELRLKTRNLEPYVVPALDLSRAGRLNEEDLYLYSVPYMQFPLRVDGRPVTGQRGQVAGFNYRRGEECFWTRHMRTVWRYYREHPDAPPMYGDWDSCPGRATGRAAWFHHFDLYLPMVRPGTRTWIDIRECTFLRHESPDSLVASLFVNEEMYLVLANYGGSPIQVASAWRWKDRKSGYATSALTVPPRGILFLQRVAGDGPGWRHGSVAFHISPAMDSSGPGRPRPCLEE
jgi:hypothetical protein